MKLNQSGEKDQRSGLICVKLKPGSHGGFLQSWFQCLFSSGKLDIVKVLHNIQIWDKQVILQVTAETIDLFHKWLPI